MIQNIEAWGDSHHPKWLDFIRIGLGIFILTKGIVFIQDTDALMEIMGGSMFSKFANLSVIHYVAFSHLVGGLLIAIGLVTRVAVAVQLPILLGAVFFVNFPQGLGNILELQISIFVLLLLLLFLVIGSGKISVDHFFNTHKAGEY